ncbi:Uncharacterised protein [Mycobacteroides abscessus]|nr:Uncharacterised protein [Mycobacteroides abscessus]
MYGCGCVYGNGWVYGWPPMNGVGATMWSSASRGLCRSSGHSRPRSSSTRCQASGSCPWASSR